VVERFPDLQQGEIKTVTREALNDEGPRRDTSPEALAKLRPAFAVKGTVTAGNSSQMSDGAGAVVLMSESALKRYNATPLGRFVTYAVAGVPPDIMGIGPVKAIPKALALAGLTQDDIDWIELNEAFAAQTLAVIQELGLDREKVSPLGGAIALGHPLGATGAIRTATLMHGLRRHKKKYGMVTMCIGTGMGAAGIFEAF
jgi:acetyl-CoA acyltransferase